MRFDFDYPVTRAYPWRLTTLLVLLFSAAVFGGLVYLNLTIVGVTVYTRYSSTFEKWKSPSWTDRLQIGSISNYTLGCESATLVAGAMYQTPNGAFTYTVQNLYDTVTSTPSSNANYNSSDLSSCRVDTISLSASYPSLEALLEASINCTLKDGIDLTATTNSLIRVSNIGTLEHTRTTALAANTTQLLTGFGSDFFEDVLFTPYGKIQPQNVPLTGLYYMFRMNTDATISWLFGSFSGQAILQRNPIKSTFGETVSPSSVQSIENYLHVLTGSILSDLGVTSQQNPLISVDAFKSAIQPLDWSFRPSDWRSFTNGVLGENMTQYNIPYDFVNATYFNAQYLCHYISWKSNYALAVDVFVATASLFMVFWAGFHVVLRHFAKHASPTGNHCECANCIDPIASYGDSPRLPLLKKYDPVPSTPTWSYK